MFLDYVVQVKYQQMSHAASYCKVVKRRTVRLLALVGLTKNKRMENFQYVGPFMKSHITFGTVFLSSTADVTYSAVNKGKCGFVVISKISWSIVPHTEPISCLTKFNCFVHFNTNHKADYHALVYKHCSCLYCLILHVARKV
jgi:hypothetical protein